MFFSYKVGSKEVSKEEYFEHYAHFFSSKKQFTKFLQVVKFNFYLIHTDNENYNFLMCKKGQATYLVFSEWKLILHYTKKENHYFFQEISKVA